MGIGTPLCSRSPSQERQHNPALGSGAGALWHKLRLATAQDALPCTPYQSSYLGLSPLLAVHTQGVGSNT